LCHIALFEGTSKGNILKATAHSLGIFGFEQNYEKALQ
jgi:hypothetical protein